MRVDGVQQQPILNTAPGFWTTLRNTLRTRLRRFTTPHPQLTDPDERARSRLLAYMSFALAVVLTLAGFLSTFTSVFFPDPSISLGIPGTVLIFTTAGGFWLSYRYSTTPMHLRGAWLMIFLIYFFITGFVILYPIGVAIIVGYVVPVLIATIFLPVAGTVRLFVFSAVMMILVLVVGMIPIVSFSVTLLVTLVVMALTVLLAFLRDQDLIEIKRLRQLELQEAERLRTELELARKVQLSMLPKDLPEVPNLELAVYSQPAYEASGDFYDVFQLSQGEDAKVGVVVCDVAGKGVSSALVMSATRAALRAEAERTPSPALVLQKVNEVLAASLPSGLFVTLFYGVYDPAERELRFASAGHPHPYLWNGEAISELQSFGMPLGLVSGSEYEDQVTHLMTGQNLFIYTDGLVEALNPQREMFGFDMVQNAVEQHSRAHSNAHELMHSTLREMEQFVQGERQQDDVTIVVLQVK